MSDKPPDDLPILSDDPEAAAAEAAARAALGERLRTLRFRTGYHQWEVAQKANVRRELLGRWEMGIAEPHLLEALTLADVYNVTLNVLVGREPMPPPIQPPRMRRGK